MNTTAISYCEYSWNPIRGCRRVSPGCGVGRKGGCYAERFAARFSGRMGRGPFHGIAEMTPAGPRWTGDVRLIESKLDEPLRARRSAEKFLREHGRKPIVFPMDMGDLFYYPDEWIDRVFAVMALAPWFDYLVLTKRAERMAAYATDTSHHGLGFSPDVCTRVAVAAEKLGRDVAPTDIRRRWPLQRVWLGVSAEDQPRFDERVPHLLKLAAAGWKTWISFEPLLGPIDVSRVPGPNACTYNAFSGRNNWNGRFVPRIDRIAIGGESGPGARPCAVENVESLLNQAGAAGVLRHVKQLGHRSYDGFCDVPQQCHCREADCEHAPTFPHANWLKLRDRAGADPAEWPERLRIREWGV